MGRTARTGATLALLVAVGCATQADNGDVPEGNSGSSSGGNSSGGGGNPSGGSSAGSNAQAGKSGSGGMPSAGTGGSDDGGSGGMMGGSSGSGGSAGSSGAGGKAGAGGSGGSAGSGGKGGSGGTAGTAGKGGTGGTGGTPVNLCANGKVDGDETDVDCGGKVCTARCTVGKGCDTVGDCVQTTGHVCDEDACRGNGCNADNCAYAITRYTVGAQQTKGQAFVTWDSDSLDILVEMLDATPFDDSDLNWEDDSVEIYLDLNHSNAEPYDADDFQITVPRAAGALSGLGAYNMGLVMVQRSSSATGYTLEIEIPWAALNGAPSQVGKTIGFDIGVNDDANGATREAQLMLHGTVNNHVNTAGFGDLTLTP